jgi:dienelactone hydrolase
MVQAAAIQIRTGRAVIEGDLTVPRAAAGIVVFAQTSGSGRFSRRNRSVARVLQDGGFATLLLDLLTRDEESIDQQTREYRFDVDRLGARVVAAIDWAAVEPVLASLPVACFGVGTGGAAALIAAAARPERVRALISHRGRPDLAGYALPRVQAPTLLIGGGADQQAIELNRAAMRRMRAPVRLEIVPGATRRFGAPGALELVSQLALRWCVAHLKRLH